MVVKFNEKGQSAITDAMFFLLIITALAALMFFFSTGYGKSINEIIQSKKLILDKYNIFPVVCNIIENNIKCKKPHYFKTKEKEVIEFKPMSFYSKKQNIFKRIINQIKNKIIHIIN